MTFKKSIKTQVEEAQFELDDCIEAKEVIENAVACGFLFDGHSLVCQNWIKEYQQRIDYLNNFLEGAKK